jgi:hypothetical protein
LWYKLFTIKYRLSDTSSPPKENNIPGISWIMHDLLSLRTTEETRGLWGCVHCSDYLSCFSWSIRCLNINPKIIRFSITTVWTFAYVHLSELFPTVVRSLALGLISAGGTIGSMSSAFVGNLSQSIGMNPLLSLGLVGTVGSLFVLALRETFGEKL